MVKVFVFDQNSILVFFWQFDSSSLIFRAIQERSVLSVLLALNDARNIVLIPFLCQSYAQSMPKRGTAEYNRLCTRLGTDPWIIEC